MAMNLIDELQRVAPGYEWQAEDRGAYRKMIAINCSKLNVLTLDKNYSDKLGMTRSYTMVQMRFSGEKSLVLDFAFGDILAPEEFDFKYINWRRKCVRRPALYIPFGDDSESVLAQILLETFD